MLDSSRQEEHMKEVNVEIGIHVPEHWVTRYSLDTLGGSNEIGCSWSLKCSRNSILIRLI